MMLYDNGTKSKLGELLLEILPREGEYVEYAQDLFAIHRIVHTEEGIKLMVIETK